MLRIGLSVSFSAVLSGLLATALALRLRYGLSLWEIAGPPCISALPGKPEDDGSPQALCDFSATGREPPALRS
ncbi:hypothetical protein BGV52_15435 [Burkholderia ubonensis]|nr:hypothetical protein BGV52_15435 [Burkholderia ubonensis]